jgi:hypothetical protein
MIFEFTIWDTHKQPIQTEDGDLVWHNVEDSDDDAPWKTFKFALEFKQVKVDYFYETVIFQQDVPVRCTRVVLSDGSSVLAKWQYDTFRERYNELKE